MDGMTTVSGMLLSVRDFPDDLVKRLKREALESNKSLREVVIEKCGGKDEGGSDDGRVGDASKRGRISSRKPKRAKVTGELVRGASKVSPAEGSKPRDIKATDHRGTLTFSVTERPWLGPKHDKDCGCAACKKGK